MAAITNKLSICLIKSSYTAFSQIVDPKATEYPIDGIGSFYIEPSHPRAPDWLTDFFGARLTGISIPLVTSSAKGVFLVKVSDQGVDYIFAVVFGFGRHLLIENAIEDRFGLKVVLNSVDHKNLRSIDKTSLGSVPKQTREQMSREAEVADFGIDIEQDLISSVTGKSRFAALGRTISGKDALSVNVKVNVNGIKALLLTCLARYQSDEYKANFGWIDQIKQVRDVPTNTALDALIEGAIGQAQFDKIWMAAPEIVDWLDVSGFRYRQPKRGQLHTDLDIRDFIASLQGQAVTIDVLRNTPVHLISAAHDDAMEHWSAYRCICAEVDHNGTIYVLNNGKWYEIVRDFALDVKKSFADLPECALIFPDYAHADEGAYNLHAVGSIPNAYLMDKKMITYGGGRSSIEFCDVATDDKRLIHIKRYGGSSQLSHLFAQGIVSGELFLQDEAFRKKLNKKLPAGRKLANSRARPVAGDYEIVFGIVSKSQNALDLPFFSKVTMRNARRRLEAYGYKVSKKKIQQV